jgi:hypothetical protein
MKPAALLTVIFLSLISLAHLIRLLYRVEIVAGEVTVPMWPSVAACLVTAGLAGWLWREQKR